MAASYPKLKLTYFNIKARAEPTRLALHIAGIPFEDKRIAHEEWPALKASMPLGQIPVRSARPAAASAAANGEAAARSAWAWWRMRGITNPARGAPTSQVLEVDGQPLAESYAILMYAGRLAKLVPEDAFKAAQV